MFVKKSQPYTYKQCRFPLLRWVFLKGLDITQHLKPADWSLCFRVWWGRGVVGRAVGILPWGPLSSEPTRYIRVTPGIPGGCLTGCHVPYVSFTLFLFVLDRVGVDVQNAYLSYNSHQSQLYNRQRCLRSVKDWDRERHFLTSGEP